MQNIINTCCAAVGARWAELTDPQESERGDSPVSTAIIVALLAAAAVAIMAVITAAATGWAAKIPL
jgi:hypothetical protein